jgi:hypothetical protein
MDKHVVVCTFKRTLLHNLKEQITNTMWLNLKNVLSKESRHKTLHTINHQHEIQVLANQSIVIKIRIVGPFAWSL